MTAAIEVGNVEILTAIVLLAPADEEAVDNAALSAAFPQSIAEAVMVGRVPEAGSKECTSVFVSSIAGFTTISGRLSAPRVAALLSRFFGRFDALAARHGVQRADVVGDAYLAATNLTVTLDQATPPPPPNPHPPTSPPQPIRINPDPSPRRTPRQALIPLPGGIACPASLAAC